MSAWQQSAPCASADPDAWFPEANHHGTEAKRICATCPYKAPCLLGAIERGETHGVWGGILAQQFGRVRRELGLRQPRTRGTDLACGAGHPREGNTYVRPDGRRVCRPCGREQVRQYRAKLAVAA